MESEQHETSLMSLILDLALSLVLAGLSTVGVITGTVFIPVKTSDYLYYSESPVLFGFAVVGFYLIALMLLIKSMRPVLRKRGLIELPKRRTERVVSGVFLLAYGLGVGVLYLSHVLVQEGVLVSAFFSVSIGALVLITMG